MLPPYFRTKGIDRPGPMVRFNAVTICLPVVPNILVSAKADSLPPPIEVITLAHGAISFGSDIDVCSANLAQYAFVGISLVFFQLTSEWNWLAGAPCKLFGLDDNSETMFCASKEISVKVFKL
jgi:hypothetical protein